MQWQGPGCGRLLKSSLIVALGRIVLGKESSQSEPPSAFPDHSLGGCTVVGQLQALPPVSLPRGHAQELCPGCRQCG